MATRLRQAARIKLTAAEIEFLSTGLMQPGGKLSLFDENGQTIPPKIIQSCLKKGLAEQWFANPMKPDWLVCRLSDAGRQVLRPTA